MRLKSIRLRRGADGRGGMRRRVGRKVSKLGKGDGRARRRLEVKMYCKCTAFGVGWFVW